MKKRKINLLHMTGYFLAALLLGTALLGSAVSAAEQTGNICLRYAAVSGAQFRLYLAGEITDNWEFRLTGEFEDIPADLNDLDTEEMTVLAETLASYVDADGIQADYTGRTDASGEVVFDGLPKGLYLVMGERVIQGGVQYDPVPFLLTVPSQDEDGNWVYQTTADVKYETSVPSEKETEYSVVKYWSGDGDGSRRPVQITVDILKDGEVFTTQTLSSENNWSYKWSAEDNGSVWSVAEREIPDGYTVQIEKNKTAFLITNTYAGEESGTPQTGDGQMPYYMIFLLAGSGLFMLMAGLVLKDREKNRRER